MSECLYFMNKSNKLMATLSREVQIRHILQILKTETFGVVDFKRSLHIHVDC
jgi:hypothetical protein